MIELISRCLSTDTIAIPFPGYPMSYIELVGTVFYLLSVWLIARKHMLTWPTGIISVILFFFLFYQIRLYSDALEQLYYLGACIYGWWFWKQDLDTGDKTTVTVKISPPKVIFFWASGTLILTVIISRFMGQVHLFFPAVFPEAASYPFIDTLTTLMSFTAMFLMARKRTESWVYWIIVDITGIWLYYIKNVKFLSVLYVILLCIAIKGLRDWVNGSVQDTGMVRCESQ